MTTQKALAGARTPQITAVALQHTNKTFDIVRMFRPQIHIHITIDD